MCVLIQNAKPFVFLSAIGLVLQKEITMLNKALKFTVEGRVKGKERHRSNFATQHHYTPKSTKDYEKLIAYSCKEAMLNNGFKPLEKGVACYLNVIAYMKTATAKPDRDNILKAVQDALNKVAYYDDSQVVGGITKKVSHKTKRCLEIELGVKSDG